MERRRAWLEWGVGIDAQGDRRGKDHASRKLLGHLVLTWAMGSH